jgi:hypothetical protein
MIARGRLSTAESYSVELFRGILADTHQEAPGPTLYSDIYDLRNRVVYIYYFHDFENVVVFDLAAELARGFHFYRLASLFPPNGEAGQYEAEWPDLSSAEISRRIVPMEASRLDDYAGQYRVRIGEPGQAVSVYLDEGRLYLHQRSSLPIELLPEGEDRFFHIFHDGNELAIAFERGDGGTVTTATGELLEQRFRLERVLDDGSAGALPWCGWVLAALGVTAVAGAFLRRIRA